MSVFTGSRCVLRVGIGVLALLGLGIATLQPAAAQTRTLASLADVPTYIPAPYHAHASTAVYGSLLYDGYSYGGGYQASGVRYWH